MSRLQIVAHENTPETCRHCKAVIKQPSTGRRKEFCNDACRNGFRDAKARCERKALKAARVAKREALERDPVHIARVAQRQRQLKAASDKRFAELAAERDARWQEEVRAQACPVCWMTTPCEHRSDYLAKFHFSG